MSDKVSDLKVRLVGEPNQTKLRLDWKMSKSKKKNAVSFTKPEEPAFLRRIKEQIGFKEGPSVDTKCQKSTLPRSTRHHEIRSIIAKRLRQAPSFDQRFWKAEEEVGCNDEDGSPRRVDILCYDKGQKVGFIIDPTVRFEQGIDQATEVDREKWATYDPCVKYFKNRYGLNQIEVIGLLVGARGTMTSFFEKFRRRFGLSPTITKEIVVAAIRGSTLTRENMPACESEDLQDRDDEKPTVVVLKSGDITQEEAEKLNAFADEEDEHDPGGKILYKQPPKRSADELQVQGKKPKKEIISTAKKVKNKSLLSFDDEEDDD